MIVEPLETINGTLDTINGPTLDNKEQGSKQTSRSDGKDVIHSSPTPLTRNDTFRSIGTIYSVATEQASVSEEREAGINDETRGGGGDDDDVARDGAADISLDWSKMGKADVTNETSEDQTSSCCLLSTLTDVGNNIDAVIHQFYSNVEIGAAKVFPGCCADALDDEAGNNKQVDSTRSPIGTTIKDITTSDVHILDTFSDEVSEDDITLVENRNMKLLDEIKDIEETLHLGKCSSMKDMKEIKMTKCSSMKDMKEIKKLQDPYLNQVSTIRQRLLDQQELLKSAPEDAKKKYYNAVSKVAVLNAEVETRRAELELKKIRLESMMVDEEMGRIMNLDNKDTFDTDMTSVDDAISHAVSDTIAFFTPFKNLRGKVRKNKDRLRHVAME